ncbi:hypothetical protein [Kitasatospora sp. NPDC001527]|uniref:hypothetical protein n=1 Tax=Kitasatospora sp. NPDC001527 TaxID=3154519 RepID=UPI00331FE76A
MSRFLVGGALAALLAIVLATVIISVITSLRMRDALSPPPITRHGRWELRALPDGTTEYTWIARQPYPHGGHRIPR